MINTSCLFCFVLKGVTMYGHSIFDESDEINILKYTDQNCAPKRYVSDNE